MFSSCEAVVAVAYLSSLSLLAHAVGDGGRRLVLFWSAITSLGSSTVPSTSVNAHLVPFHEHAVRGEPFPPQMLSFSIFAIQIVSSGSQVSPGGGSP